MKYKIKITDTCLEEIEDICEYINKKLKAEKASIRLRKKIRESILVLKESPKMKCTPNVRQKTNIWRCIFNE